MPLGSVCVCVCVHVSICMLIHISTCMLGHMFRHICVSACVNVLVCSYMGTPCMCYPTEGVTVCQYACVLVWAHITKSKVSLCIFVSEGTSHCVLVCTHGVTVYVHTHICWNMWHRASPMRTLPMETGPGASHVWFGWDRDALVYVKEISVGVLPSRCWKSDSLSPPKT